MPIDMSVFKCVDCKVDTSHRTGIGEYYMVHDHIWDALNLAEPAMMCIGCLEARVGHKLRPMDFTGCPLNIDNVTDPKSSKRLVNRLTGFLGE